MHKYVNDTDSLIQVTAAISLKCEYASLKQTSKVFHVLLTHSAVQMQEYLQTLNWKALLKLMTT